jgi:hypothetical protein
MKIKPITQERREYKNWMKVHKARVKLLKAELKAVKEGCFVK